MATERLIVEIELDNGKVIKGTTEIEKSVAKAGERGARRFEGAFSNSTKNIVRNIAALAAGFSAFNVIRGAISSVRELETAFAEIKTIIPDVTQANNQLRQSLIDTSAQFGTTAAEQANAFYTIISSGITDTAKAQELLTQANKLAIGGLTDVNTAINILTSSIKSYGEENLSAQDAADILFSTVRLGKTRVEELSASLGLVLPSAKAIGVGFKDVNAALAALTTRGISTSVAVTQINSIFTSLLRNQAVAKKFGPEVASAFSLQALQAKGLTRFLFDLNNAVGGNEQALIKLFGRIEGAKALFTLAGDNFKTLSDNIRELENSTGAADAAFEEINQTLNQQLKVLSSNFQAQLLNLGNSTQGILVSLVGFLNSVVLNLSNSFNFLGFVIANIGPKILSFVTALKLLPIILSTSKAGLLGFISQITLIPTRLALAALSLQNFRASLSAIKARGVVGSLKLIGTGFKGLARSVKLARIAVNVFKAAATLGLTLVLDALIEKVIELKDEFGGFKKVFTLFRAVGERAFFKVNNAILKFIRLGTRVPIVGNKFKEAFGPGLDEAIGFNEARIKGLNEEIDKLFKKPLEFPPTGDFVGPPEPPKPEAPGLPQIDPAQFEANNQRAQASLDSLTNKVKEQTEIQVSLADSAWGRIANIIDENAELGAVSLEKLNEAAQKSFRTIAKSALVQFASSFQVIGKALVEGENAFAAFGKSILGVLGDVAIDAGKTYFLLGVASFNGAQAAAGLALIALGGAIKALAGSGGKSGASGGAGGFAQSPTDQAINPQPVLTDQIDERARVAVNIQGDVFDNEETGLKIATIIKDQFGSNGVVIS